MEFIRFIKKPSIAQYPGIVVDENTELKFENENVTQEVKDLVLKTRSKVVGDGYESVCCTTIFLKKGDVLLYEDEDRGYIKPVEDFMTIAQVIEELEHIKEL